MESQQARDVSAVEDSHPPRPTPTTKEVRKSVDSFIDKTYAPAEARELKTLLSSLESEDEDEDEDVSPIQGRQGPKVRNITPMSHQAFSRL